jgi:predicted nucleic acid-binding protein
LLAATAKVHRMILVTRNAADIADLGAEVLNPLKTGS